MELGPALAGVRCRHLCRQINALAESAEVGGEIVTVEEVQEAAERALTRWAEIRAAVLQMSPQVQR